MHHAGYVQGLIWYSYLTGDPVGIEGRKGIADWVLRNSKIHVIGMERQLGHPLTTLNDVYEATGEEKYLHGASRLVTQALTWEHPLRSGFLRRLPNRQLIIRDQHSAAAFCRAPLMKFNAWANQPEIDAVLRARR